MGSLSLEVFKDVAQRFSGHGGDGLVVGFDGRT